MAALRTLIPLLGLAIFGMVVPAAPASASTSYSVSWATESPMPTPRQSMGATTASNGKIYVIGGYRWPNTLATNEEYDPSTNSWAERAPLPSPQDLVTPVATPDGKIYVIGGTDSAGNLVSTNAVYDVATDTWSQAAPLPTARPVLIALGPNGKIYTFGGATVPPYGFSTLVEVYDPSTNTWACSTNDTAPSCSSATLAPMPSAVWTNAIAATQDGRFFFLSGNTDCCTYVNTVMAYNLYTNTWACSVGDGAPGCSSTGLAVAPFEWSGFETVTAGNGRIYVMGGQDNIGGCCNHHTDVEEYDPVCNSWTQQSPLPTSLSGGGATLGPDGKIYVIGGVNGSGEQSSVYQGTLTGTVDTTPKTCGTAPSISPPAMQTSNEGTVSQFSLGSFADPDGGPWTVDVNWGDGTPDSTFTATVAGGLGSLPHTYDDGANPYTPYTVTETVTDSTNLSDTKTFTVDVANVPPTITSIAGPTTVLSGLSLTYSGTATDLSTADTKVGFTWQWLIDGGSAVTGNPSTLSFSSCGSHTVSATATDKDGGTSNPVAETVSVYAGVWLPPLVSGRYNVAKAGSVIPVKISVGCNGSYLTNLAPAIQLIQGNVNGTSDTGTNYVSTTSSSSADTTGVMRLANPNYIYNLKVPTGYPTGTDFTIRVRPFGDSDPADGMYVLIQTQ